ncbi:Spy/CpxP family protein refolding chaperone [Chromobacterium sphagni]|uniref:Spy/CpxP family protein refolding chaperone n=1 Tax=Chromobacterium sphagni TaxID=1903179 RepID=UPI00195977D3|nr:Spy/CpxP family protein refolding chaperone [Chromobacterium sphagni]
MKATAPALLLLASLSISATAQTASPNHAGTRVSEQKAQKRADYLEKRIRELHAKLKITDKQSTQWDAYAKTMRDNADSTDQAFRDRGQKLPTLNADEAMKSYADLAQLHADNMKKLAASFHALYGVLSDEQKAIADKLFRHEQEEHHHRRHK